MSANSLARMAPSHRPLFLEVFILERFPVDAFLDKTGAFSPVLRIVRTVLFVRVQYTIVNDPDSGVVDVLADVAAILLGTWRSGTNTQQAFARHRAIYNVPQSVR